MRYISDPAGAKQALSFTPSDDGLSAKAVFDTTGLLVNANWYVELYLLGEPTNFGYQQVTVVATTEAAKPYVQAVVAPNARGGVVSYDYLHYGNAGKGPSPARVPATVGLPGGR